MSTLAKKDAMELVALIRGANVGAHAMAARIGGGSGTEHACFLGGLESVIATFLQTHGCPEAAQALHGAMNDAPTGEEIAARNALVESMRGTAEETVL